MDELKERILIVDDDPGLLVLLTKTLSRYGYFVVSATDGYQALDALQELAGVFGFADRSIHAWDERD